MCALPRRRPPSLLPRSPDPGAPPPALSPPPQALPSPGCRGKEDAGKQEGWKSGSEPADAVPPGPAARAQGARGSAAEACCRCGGSCCSCGCGWAGDSGCRAPGAGRRGTAAGATRGHSPHAAALPLPGSLASKPAPPRNPGQRRGRKRGSPAVRAAFTSAPSPAALLQSRPPPSAWISSGCSARASYLRPGRAPATEHAQCRFASPAQGAAAARFHFSRLWRRLRELRLEGPGRAGAEREKGGAGGGGRGGGADSAPRATPAGRGCGTCGTHAPTTGLGSWQGGNGTRVWRPKGRESQCCWVSSPCGLTSVAPKGS